MKKTPAWPANIANIRFDSFHIENLHWKKDSILCLVNPGANYILFVTYQWLILWRASFWLMWSLCFSVDYFDPSISGVCFQSLL